jgi:hypothetical protein
MAMIVSDDVVHMAVSATTISGGGPVGQKATAGDTPSDEPKHQELGGDGECRLASWRRA